MVTSSIHHILKEIFKNLDDSIKRQNFTFRVTGKPEIQHQKIIIEGKMALILGNLPFEVTSTMRIDISGDMHPHVSSTLELLLNTNGFGMNTLRIDDSASSEVNAECLMSLPNVKVMVAGVEDALVSIVKRDKAAHMKILEKYFWFYPERKTQILSQVNL